MNPIVQFFHAVRERYQEIPYETKKFYAILSIPILLFLILLIFTIDYVVYRDARIKNNMADQFCQCSMNEKVRTGSFESTEEGFQYALGLESCFAEKFKTYSDGLSDKEKEKFIADLMEKVFQKCPKSVEKVFGDYELE